MNAAVIGEWFASLWRTRAKIMGTYKAASLMAEHGIPIHIAIATLARR